MMETMLLTKMVAENANGSQKIFIVQVLAKSVKYASWIQRAITTTEDKLEVSQLARVARSAETIS